MRSRKIQRSPATSRAHAATPGRRRQPIRVFSQVVANSCEAYSARNAGAEAKEKSASDHMTLAEKKLNHFQKHQQSKTSNINTIPSSSKSKPKEISPKLSKVC